MNQLAYGELLEALGQEEEAMRAYDLALLGNPGMGKAHLRKAWFWVRLVVQFFLFVFLEKKKIPSFFIGFFCLIFGLLCMYCVSFSFGLVWMSFGLIPVGLVVCGFHFVLF